MRSSSPTRSSPPGIDRHSPSHIASLIPDRGSPERSYLAQPDRSSPTRLRYSDEDQLAEMFKQQITLQREVEGAKERLSICGDLNLPDLYHIFESQSMGILTLRSFENVLNQFGIYPRAKETLLLLKQYANGNTWLNFETFCRIFTPKNQNFARIL
jgi:hypothetical protein